MGRAEIVSEQPAAFGISQIKRDWTLNIWEGLNFFAWLRLLIRNRFAVHWSFWYIACIVTVVSFLNTTLHYLQELFYGRRLRRTRIREDPLFIIGHWRTGTTFLHQLLALDDRHTYPNTYECFAPNHFLLTERFFTRWLSALLPKRRPMDNMPVGWERPQEDEFALCMLGLPSPYLTIAFPNHAPQCQEYFDLEGLSPEALYRWKKGFMGFLRRLTLKSPKRLVLKSPPHTCRVRVLVEMFPDARFVHIVRDPYVVFPSTMNMRKSLYEAHGLQRPTFSGLEEYVFGTFNHLYENVDAARKLIDPARFYEIRYEDLVRDPVGEMRGLYEHLRLGGFDEVEPRLKRYLAAIAGYETNRYQLSPRLRAEITRRLGWVIRKYGYEITG
ncbi:MAG: sulfotransferase [Deltaproteobacteria bacterium]|nr:sulfotransferase [Deltaproteobacteria bacterium]